MVKYDKKRTEIKDFEKLLQEIRDCDENETDSDFSYGNVEFSASEADSESSEDFDGERSTDTEVEYVPGKFYSLIDNVTCISEHTDDFPKENEDSDIQLTYEELKKLTIVDRKEYKDNKNIINPNKKPTRMQRRCKNIDD
ncbi:hypothetical protein GINT2_002009 [Glugoides intestinalis]